MGRMDAGGGSFRMHFLCRISCKYSPDPWPCCLGADTVLGAEHGNTTGIQAEHTALLIQISLLPRWKTQQRTTRKCIAVTITIPKPGPITLLLPGNYRPHRLPLIVTFSHVAETNLPIDCFFCAL